MSVTPLKVLIVGGGVAGPVMAMVLQKLTKHTVILVDANPEDASPVGAAIGIAPNGLNALKFIGADHVVTDIGGRVECMAVGNGETGELLANESVLDTFTEKFGCTVGFTPLVRCACARAERIAGLRRCTTRSMRAPSRAGQTTGDRHPVQHASRERRADRRHRNGSLCGRRVPHR